MDEVDYGLDYESVLINAKIVFSLNCKTLT